MRQAVQRTLHLRFPSSITHVSTNTMRCRTTFTSRFVPNLCSPNTDDNVGGWGEV